MNRFFICTIFVSSLVLLACQSDRPHRDLLEQHELVPILVDFHLVFAIQSSTEFREISRNSDSVDTYSYIFDKYGVDRVSFDSSIAWYSRHPNQFAEIYDEVVMILTQMNDSLEAEEKR
jgi:hypothetical protein